MTGTAVQFGQSGRLVDGQHRLQAIIDSGITMRMLVVHGVDDSVFDVIDSGSRRTGADLLHIDGHQGWISVCGSTASGIAKSLMCGLQPYGNNYTPQDVRQFVVDSPMIMESAIFMSGLPRKGVPLAHSAGAALHFLMVKKDAVMADSFMRKFYTGEELSAGDSILLLRNILISRAMGNTPSIGSRTASLLGTIRVWNAAREGRGFKYIQNAFRIGEAWPLIG